MATVRPSLTASASKMTTCHITSHRVVVWGCKSNSYDVLESETELRKARVLPMLQVVFGDVVRDTALGDEDDVGRLVRESGLEP